MLLQHKMKKVAKAERWARATEPLPTGTQRAVAQGPFPTTISWEAKGLSPRLLLRETALLSWFAMVWLEILQEKSHVLDMKGLDVTQGRDHISWHQPEDAWAAPPALNAPQGWFGFPFPSERLLSLSSTSSTWRDTGKELFQQIFSYRREGGTWRELPAARLAEPLAGTGAQQVRSSPGGHQQIFPITHRKRCGWAGKAILSLHTPSPEPSPHPCFPLVDVPAAGAPASAGALQRGGGLC